MQFLEMLSWGRRVLWFRLDMIAPRLEMLGSALDLPAFPLCLERLGLDRHAVRCIPHHSLRPALSSCLRSWDVHRTVVLSPGEILRIRFMRDEDISALL